MRLDTRTFSGEVTIDGCDGVPDAVGLVVTRHRDVFTFCGTMSDALHGLYARDGYALTQLQPSYARTLFPCFDDPALKATFDLTVIADTRHRVIANTPAVRDEPLPDGRHAVTFARTPRMATYLLGIAIGSFKTVSEGGPSPRVRGEGARRADEGPPASGARGHHTAIHLHSLASDPNHEFVLDIARHALDFYDRWFPIPYPLPKLDLVVVPELETAAMETTGSIWFREAALRETRPRVARLVAHEIAHQWFGSLVTPASWDELWLSEGFATWIASKAMPPELRSEVDDVRAMQTAMAADSLTSSLALHGSRFDPIAYEKSAALLRMLEAWLGEDAFRAGVHRYLERHAGGNATAADLWSALGDDVAAIATPFVTKPGVPRIAFDWNDEVVRITSSTTDPIPVGLRIGDETRYIVVSGTAEVKAAPFVFGNAGATGYYRSSYTRPVDPSKLTRAEQVVLLEDAWAAVWDCTSDVLAFLRLVRQLDREVTRDALRDLRDLLASGPRAAAFDAIFGATAIDTSESLESRIANPATRAAAWAELKETWDALRPDVVAFGGHGVLPALASISDPVMRHDVATFFAGRDLGDAERTLRQVLERIDSRIRFREREQRKFDAWLMRQSAPSAAATDALRAAHAVLNALSAGYHGAASGRALLDSLGFAAPAWMHPAADLRAVTNGLDQLLMHVFRGAAVLNRQLADLAARLEEDLVATATLLESADRALGAAMLVRQATVRELFLGGLIAFADLFGTAEEADRWRTQLRGTEEEVLRARALVRRLDDPQLAAALPNLPAVFRGQAADLASLQTWLHGAIAP